MRKKEPVFIEHCNGAACTNHPHSPKGNSDYMYACGYYRPRYPVPAIRQGWEIVHQLGDMVDEPYVWMHWQQERF